jgi:hypothetical protein
MTVLLLMSRPVVSLIVRAVHGGSLPPRMWLSRPGSAGPMMITRTRSNALTANVLTPDAASSPIEFLGAESYIAGLGAPFWSSPNPVPFLKRETNCTLTAYSADLSNLSASPLMSNYQDVLHQQAALTTTGDKWASGCADSRIGVPSGSAIFEETASGSYYGAIGISYGFFYDTNNVSVRTATSDLSNISSPTNLPLPGVPATLTSVDLNKDGNPDLVVVSFDEDTSVATLTVFLDNGDGTYQASPKNYPTTLEAVSVTVAPLKSGGRRR